MKTKQLLILALTSTLLTARGAIVGFDLSPAGTDNAVGLSPLNETPPVTNSSGSGNEIGSGITFNTDTLTLNLSLAYGSAFGFTDLTGAATAMHIHGPAPTNAPAPVLIDLGGFHVPATNAATGGAIVGSVVLTTNQAADLLAGLDYINVHTATNAAGEIRGQLILVNVLPALICPAAVTLECTGGDGTFASLTAQVSDEDGDPLTIIWSANGVALQTNTVAAGASTNVTSVTFDGSYQVGTNVVTLSVSDGVDSPSTCSTTVTVVDTTPPVIVSKSVTPSILWPPNHKLIPVQVSIVATDLCGTVTSKIKSISSNQGVLAKGSGNKSPDWKITGDLSALVRAERTGKDKNGRTYTITIESTDDSGNSASTTVTVFVPHDQGHHDPVPPVPESSDSNGNGDDKGKGKSDPKGDQNSKKKK